MTDGATAPDAAIAGPFDTGPIDTGPTDTDPDAAFDDLTAMVARLLGAPVALVSIVETARDRQVFKSQLGLGEPWAARGQTPLSHSICKHVVASGLPLVVGDARTDPRLADNGAVRELGVVAYLGAPIRRPDGAAVGALCAIDGRARAWGAGDVALLSGLATSVTTLILLRATQADHARLHDALRRERRHLREHSARVEALLTPGLGGEPTLSDRLRALLRHGCRGLDMGLGTIARVGGGTRHQVLAAGRDGPGPEGVATALERTPCALVAAARGPVRLPALGRDGVAAFADPAGRPIGAYLGTPLVVDGALYGTLSFTDQRPRPQGWSEAELSLIGLLASTAAASLALLDEPPGGVAADPFAPRLRLGGALA